MPELKLVTETDKPPKPKDWRIERIAYWREKHLEYVGRQAKLGYGAMMQMLESLWQKHHGYTDTETGEIVFDIPPIDDWKDETDWFFKDKWAGEKCGYFFGYFIQKYGSFHKFEVAEKPIVQYDTCKFCGQKIKRTQLTSHYYSCTKNPNLRQ